MLKDLLAVFVGGGLGSAARYVLGLCLPAPAGTFPWPTFAANVCGCFLIGLFASLSAGWAWPVRVRLGLTVGLCGGFTTFSTFSRESLSLLQGGHPRLAAAYVVASLGIGLVAVALGAWVGVRCRPMVG